MERGAILAYATLAYRRMKSLEHDEKVFEATLSGIMREYSIEEVYKDVNKREEK